MLGTLFRGLVGDLVQGPCSEVLFGALFRGLVQGPCSGTFVGGLVRDLVQGLVGGPRYTSTDSSVTSSLS